MHNLWLWNYFAVSMVVVFMVALLHCPCWSQTSSIRNITRINASRHSMRSVLDLLNRHIINIRQIYKHTPPLSWISGYCVERFGKPCTRCTTAVPDAVARTVQFSKVTVWPTSLLIAPLVTCWIINIEVCKMLVISVTKGQDLSRQCYFWAHTYQSLE